MSRGLFSVVSKAKAGRSFLALTGEIKEQKEIDNRLSRIKGKG
jgi:hypothetical protein